MQADFLIVGAGFAGITLAERISSCLNRTVLIVERRTHIGGNSFDFYNEDGILVQKYGPHIFHTDSELVWSYLSQFTEWNVYSHRVLAHVSDKEVYLPINLVTMEQLYGRTFTSESLQAFFDSRRIACPNVQNAGDVIVSQVGEELYELFFKNYTKKQWGVYPDQLSPQVTRRLPIRLNRDTRYFSDKYQGLPKNGYTRMFERMLSQPNIRILLNTDYRDVCDQIDSQWVILTGPIDYYFDYRFGKLPYRSLRFEFVTLDKEWFQDAGVVNYPNDYEYIRITEFKHLYCQRHHRTTICYEYPSDEGDPYYPVPSDANQDLYERYAREAEKLAHTRFTGRLGTYQYLNMDQVVAQSLSLFEQIGKDHV